MMRIKWTETSRADGLRQIRKLTPEAAQPGPPCQDWGVKRNYSEEKGADGKIPPGFVRPPANAAGKASATRSGRRGSRATWRGSAAREGAFASRGSGYKRGARSRSGQMRPPSLLSLTLDSALLRIAHTADLSQLPDHLVIDLFRVENSRAGKLTPKVLKLFLATGCEEIILAVQVLNIKQPLVPVLPTTCFERF